MEAIEFRAWLAVLRVKEVIGGRVVVVTRDDEDGKGVELEGVAS